MPIDDDLQRRSDDYELRMAQAGSTEGIISGLVRGAERNVHIIRWLIASVIIDVILLIAFGSLTIVSYHNDKDVDLQALTACTQSNKNSVVINNVLQALIENTNTNTTFSPQEKASRITSYQGLTISIPKC